MESDRSKAPEDRMRGVAVIGIAGRFPGANNPSDLWSNLLAGKSAITRVPAERWPARPDQADEFWGAFIDNADCFDASFFRISPKEAELMDPQQRILLEVVWHLFEDARIKPSALAGQKIGAYVGVCNSDYGELVSENGLMPTGLYASTGTSASILSNRVSYHFDLRGPSVTVDTACSSSLVAVHLAASAIENGECVAAIAGGTNICWTPGRFLAFDKAGMLASDGQCKTFDARANGYVRGEGVGAVLLKALDRAIADGDRIYGVVKATAVNHGGRTGGLTITSPERQAELLVDVYAKAGVSPCTVGYVEVHGPGTSLGDPIEFLGLDAAFTELAKRFEESLPPKKTCALGSIKTHIGHLESAAGVAGLIKMLLALKHKTIPANRNFARLNPMIEMDTTPFYIPIANESWEAAPGAPRRAGVSSFGYGGAYAHVVVEEFPQSTPDKAASSVSGSYILPLSARTRVQLTQYARLIAAELAGPCDIASIAYSLQASREHFEERVAILATTREEAIERINRFLDSDFEDSSGVYCGRASKDLAGIASSDEPAALAPQWAKGIRVGWQALYTTTPQVTDLPQYPFARDRFWLPKSKEGVADSLHSKRVANSRDKATRNDFGSGPYDTSEVAPELLLLQEEWIEDDLDDAGAAPGSRNIAVLLSNPLDEPTVRAVIGELSTQCNVDCFIVSDRRRDCDDRCEVDIAESTSEDMADFLRAIRDKRGSIDFVFDLSVLDRRTTRLRRHASALVKAADSAAVSRIGLLIAGEAASVEERSKLEALIGYQRSLPMISSTVSLSVIHESVESTHTQDARVARWIRRLWREANQTRPSSAWYRNDHRYVLKVREVEDAASVGELDAGCAFRPGGVYLITGGLGGLGYLLAQYLAKKYSARLILTGRSPQDGAIDGKIRVLESAGADVIYFAADVARRGAMEAVLEQAATRFGPLQGVIHAAGVDDGARVIDRDPLCQDQILSPKIDGTLVLQELLAPKKLDFICYFSSSAAVLGDFGSCDYAAANRFQLGHAKYSPHKALAVCWPLWIDGGMGWENPEATRLYLKSGGQAAMTTAQGLALLEWLLVRHRTSGWSHAVVLIGQRERLLSTLSRIHESQSPAPDLQSVKTRTPGLRGVGLRDCFLSELRSIAGALLKLAPDKIIDQEHFAEFGFDSIGLADFAKEISARYAIPVTPSVFFSYGSLSTLADHLLDRNQSFIASYYGEALPPALKRRSQAPFGSGVDGVDPHSDSRNDSRGAQTDSDDRIAIIGMSGRFPGARSTEELWTALCEGRQAIEEIPLSRFDWRDCFVQENPGEARGPAKGKTHSKWIGLLPGAEEFDPLFFEISPKDAVAMDPRQRLLLQESYRALEDAGYGSAQLAANRIGVFVGVEQGDYQAIVGKDGSLTSNHDGVLAARLSYYLNLSGPAMAINTACSSGLVAVHQACASLRAGECDTAVAGSANLITTSDWYVSLQEAGMLSPDGRCFAFDRRANGMVPGEAVVAIVLKKQSQAKLDGDRIYAVIVGSGINSDGRTNGLTAPNGAAQSKLIREVYRRARVEPHDIDYVVTHGTGTRLGDPVEVNALREAFGGECPAPYCALTSTKSNFGHSFAASGLLSLVSLVQAMRHETIPASLLCEQLNDYIDWRNSPFYVNTKNKPWRGTTARPRRGAVSAFGMSGTNAHAVLESYECDDTDRHEASYPRWYLLPLSAKTEAALVQRAKDLLDCASDVNRIWDAATLADLSYTLLARRQHFAHRGALVVESIDQARSMLAKFIVGERATGMSRGKVAHDWVEQPALKRYGQTLVDELRQNSVEPESYRESLTALADLYCQGYSVDSSGLRHGYAPRCISLPGYPFLRNGYWLKRERSVDIPSAVRSSATFHAELFASVLDDVADGKLSIESALARVMH